MGSTSITMRTGVFAIGAVLGLVLAVSGGPAFAGEAWSVEEDCSSCHVTQAEVDGDAKPSPGAETSGGGTSSLAGDKGPKAQPDSDAPSLYASHVDGGRIEGCAACHATDEEVLAEAHENYRGERVRLPRRLADTEVPNDVCLSCHEPDALVEVTADSTALTDEEGTTLNPHEMATLASHIEGGEAKADLTCVSCHEVHEKGSTDHSIIDERAAEVCAGCHHANVFTCGTCHD